ncbi:uncharacterized protein LOC114936004 [Nylanderia fulva]|uniref:uncharacterized protein LOC114936004 n=1 Tax=Nylanderia fulva TaxID=613905 RepID=UPI0010FB2764|nr:uncharacterized protein LOC114936004 [Nylanderia fulva]
MGWYVVKFANEDTVEAIPKSWYLKNTKECNWPSSHWTSRKINEFIKFKKTPESDWNLHKVDILGSYEDLSVAQRKANKAKYTSDLSSQNDKCRKQHSKPKGKRNKSTKYLSDNDSSDLSQYESDINSYPPTSPLISSDGNLVQNIPTEVVTKSTECNIPRNFDADFQKQVLKELNAIHLKLNDNSR